MEQLSGQDASFVYLETPHTPMHIGSVAIYDPSTAPGGFVRFKDILSFIQARLAGASEPAFLIARNPLVSLGLDARVDGAGFWAIYFKIMLPMSLPIFVVAIILQVTGIWNDFLFGASFSGADSTPMTVARQTLFGQAILAARAQGLGACLTSWASYGGEKILRDAVGVPDDWMLGGHIVVGWPKGRHGRLRRRPLTHAVNLDRWDEPADDMLAARPPT